MSFIHWWAHLPLVSSLWSFNLKHACVILQPLIIFLEISIYLICIASAKVGKLVHKSKWPRLFRRHFAKGDVSLIYVNYNFAFKFPGIVSNFEKNIRRNCRLQIWTIHSLSVSTLFQRQLQNLAPSLNFCLVVRLFSNLTKSRLHEIF